LSCPPPYTNPRANANVIVKKINANVIAPSIQSCPFRHIVLSFISQHLHDDEQGEDNQHGCDRQEPLTSTNDASHHTPPTKQMNFISRCTRPKPRRHSAR